MPDKKYPDIQDLLPEGKHRVKVYPKNEWKDGVKIEGSHKQGVNDKGFKWYMYSTKVGDKYVTLFASDEDKEWFDSGEVEVNIIQKVDRATKEPIWAVRDGKPVKVLKAFINEIKDGEKPYTKTVERIKAKQSEPLPVDYTDKINIAEEKLIEEDFNLPF